MAKVKFYFNAKTLSFDPVKKNRKTILKNIILYTFAFFFIALSGFISFSFFFKSPFQKRILRELDHLKFNYSLLEKRMRDSDAILNEIQQRDNKIYRVIFEIDPISNDKRTFGFGGKNRYKDLKGFKNSDLVIGATKKMDILAKRLVVQSKSLDEIVKLATEKQNMLASIPAIQPVSNKDLSRIASGYGIRIHPIYKTKRMHWGMDFSAPKGTKIHATGNGIVYMVQKSQKGYGNHVVINHGFGYKTTYAHMSNYFVRVGQKVKRGEVIGIVGSTGTSTAPHLHYEVKKGNQHYNPVYFYQNDLTPEEYEKVLYISSQENQSLD